MGLTIKELPQSSKGKRIFELVSGHDEIIDINNYQALTHVHNGKCKSKFNFFFQVCIYHFIVELGADGLCHSTRHNPKCFKKQSTAPKRKMRDDVKVQAANTMKSATEIYSVRLNYTTKVLIFL